MVAEWLDYGPKEWPIGPELQAGPCWYVVGTHSVQVAPIGKSRPQTFAVYTLFSKARLDLRFAPLRCKSLRCARWAALARAIAASGGEPLEFPPGLRNSIDGVRAGYVLCLEAGV